MRLLSFALPDESVVRVGLVAGRGDRVVDLGAVGVEDMFDAAARTRELHRAAPHLLRAAGALAYPAAGVRALAPLPVARTAWVQAPAARGPGRALAVQGEVGRPTLRYADPAPIGPPAGSTLDPRAAAGVRFGIACVVGAEAHVVSEAAAEQALAGYCLAAWIPTADAAADGAGETAAGPWLVTPDELADRRIRPGVFDLEVRAAVNGRTVYQGSWSALPVGPTDVVVQAAAVYTLRPGDMLCVPADGGRAVLRAAMLAPGDEVVFEVERLGALGRRVGVPATPIL
jgi:fumarylacetoacetate (FAA) hydrolase